ncbi:MAG TPA: B12-binding domain-containing radical SAM protein [Verrucomicrobiales bacterium]|nr:B12-binding domain-containing radical SAM protein [Verrucomicrobiales bacterium]
MKIGLIAMSGVRVRTKELAELGVTLPGFVRRGKVIASLPSLGLLTIAGMTPPEHDVHYLEIAELQVSTGLPDFDLVGISSLSAQIDEAYDIADRYRARGSRVVMGGLHVSMLPEEALEHADAVVTGGAEGVWPQVVRDAEAGRLRPRYSGARDRVFELPLYAQPRFELLAGREYNRVTIQTSRGCPRACEFCAASLRITDRYNQKPVALVMDELREARRWFKQPFFELADDNTFLNRAWSREFLTELRRENIHWFTETDVSIADDPALCDLLADSGCRQVLIGFESPGATEIAGIDPANWKSRQAPRYRRVIDILQSRGVSVNGCFILGLDAHTTDVFPAVLEFVKTSGLAEVQFTVLTPFPGTPLHQRLKREGRLLFDRFWDRCTLFDVNYRPARMSVEQLESGLRWLFAEAYSGKATRDRLRGFARQAGRATRWSPREVTARQEPRPNVR